MAKRRHTKMQRAPRSTSTSTRRRGSLWFIGSAIGVTILVWVGFQFVKNRASPSASKMNSDSRSIPNPAVFPGRGGQETSTSAGQGVTNQNTASAPLGNLEVAQAVIVTVELDFEATVPSIATALLDIERRYQPDDGTGRTFAILDAYGERTPSGKLLISMHISTEKPGTGSLIFKRTGGTLWSSRIIPSKDPKKTQFTGKNLSIYIDDGAGKLLTIDGSNNPTWIMDAVVKERVALLDTVWPTGIEHEVTFIYSACGCPVKVTARREGDRVVRTKDLPVMFPDDPAAVELIGRLMRW